MFLSLKDFFVAGTFRTKKALFRKFPNELENQEAVYTFADALKIPIAAVSLGGVESILSYPVTMSHACVPKEEREKQGVTEGLLRLSVGIEDTEDLLADLEQALEQVLTQKEELVTK